MTDVRELVILSLEPWDDVWRRNQLMVQALINDSVDLRVLFVEPPLVALRNLERGSLLRTASRSAGVRGVTALHTVQWIPDRLRPFIPPVFGRSVHSAVRTLGFRDPVLWVNDHSRARFAIRSGWRIVYDITDDWLLVDAPATKRRRAQMDDELLLRSADAVVVCSPALAASRGTHREVVLIPNGVDRELFATPQARPADLPAGPVAVYVGSLHEDRLDIRLCGAMADELRDVNFAYVGPDYLRPETRRELVSRSNVWLLGPRPHKSVPAYLQHADVIVIPHVVSPFTESLDPIKARECLVVGTPTVATPVAGFRDLGPPIRIAPAPEFAPALAETLLASRRVAPPTDVWTWMEASRAFGAVIESVSRSGPRSDTRGFDD
jgi:teichuronic acid biosynthesis glycosyltransferase TuaH